MALRAAVATPFKVVSSRRSARRTIVRAAEPETPTPTPIVLPSGSDVKPQSLGEAMAFAGAAPERVNGRLAMLGVVAAIGAELATGESVLAQATEIPVPLAILVVSLAVATLAPILKGANMKEAFGPLTPQAEVINGRAAMLGIAALLAAEVARGGAALL
ncbi:hypothetical protein HYH03_001463 [Edaphochlamys debaryana]|uniref:Uncharacterized protein n=1 Tax=Edaphochlamys debaryana TaxID=47281 RepID=A0A836C6G9_9CHLO|nr:hypothetical protein HYH03_001463 [Edaphochlamys debaryana]|eukprot:KAG2500697.1 hypothetical protein HYH03_001463 [Edaphochlamys debaryana]